jgi:hypothetical protein
MTETNSQLITGFPATNSLLQIGLIYGWSVKLPLAFANTVVPGFSLVEIHDQEILSLLDMYVFRNFAFSLKNSGRSFYVGALCCIYVAS